MRAFSIQVLAVGAITALLAACGGAGPVGPAPGVPGGGGPTSHFFLPTGEPDNTTDPTVEVDASGGVHTVYPAYAIGNAYYAYCPADCRSPEQVAVVMLPTDGTVDNVMLALGADGKPQVLMSTYQRVYYATCAGDCTQGAAWTMSVILEHGGELEVSGEAFALDPYGRPRFVTHSYRSLYGSSEAASFFALCDADCHNPANWGRYEISDQVWQESTLRFTAAGGARLATVASVVREDGSTQEVAAYVQCDAACTDGSSWIGTGLYAAYSDRYIEEIDPAVSLALTRAGSPRMLVLGMDEAGGRNLVYLHCETNCTGDGWGGQVLIGGEEGGNLGAGLDLALDAQDRPRFAYTAASNILLAFCDTACETPEAPWDLTKVEFGSDMPPDQVIPYPNCTVSAWFLRDPSVAIGLDGLPRVAYRAEDISGGFDNPDPTVPDCVAGTDMTFSRFAQLGSYSE